MEKHIYELQELYVLKDRSVQRFSRTFLWTGIRRGLLKLTLLVLFVGIHYGWALTPPSGSGTSADPYQISSLENLQWVIQNSGEWGAYYEQTADIDASATQYWDDSDDNGDGNWYNDAADATATGNNEGFLPIGNDPREESSEIPFSGSYDGKGYTITGLHINRSGNFTGFFGGTSEAVVKNLRLESVTVTGNDYTGGLVGMNYSSSTFTNCYVTGSISGQERVGGLIGDNTADGTVSQCYTSCTVQGTNRVGGLIGYNASAEVQECYTNGTVTAEYKAGGLIGYAYGSGTIANNYSSGDITRQSSTQIAFGGLIGYIEQLGIEPLTIQYNYATGHVYSSPGVDWNEGGYADKGFAGQAHGSLLSTSANYFDSQASNQATDGTGVAAPKNTVQMQNLCTFSEAGWDFSATWTLSTDNGGYPALAWQGYSHNATCEVTTWNGSSWDNGTPDSEDIAIFEGDYTTASALACLDLTIHAGIQFTANHTVTVSGDLTLKAGEAGFASLMDKGNMTIHNQTVVQQYLVEDRWWYVAPQVTGARAGNALQTDQDTYRQFQWNETDANHGWNELAAGDALTPLTGYAYFNKSPEAITASWEGTLNSGNQGVTGNMTRTAGVAREGFNLTGNPYPSHINWGSENNPTPGLTKTNLASTIWVRKDGNFATYNWSDNGTGQNGGSQYIAPGQAFWVQVKSGFTSGTLKLTNETRLHHSQALLKNNQNHLLRLHVSRENYTDEAVIGFYPEAETGFEGHDSKKMFATDARYPQLYMPVEERRLAINGLPRNVDKAVILLGFKTEKAGTFTLKAGNIADFTFAESVSLKDNQTGAVMDLRKQNQYSFSTEGAVDQSERFSLHLAKSAAKIAPAKNGSLKVYSHRQSVYLQNPLQRPARVQIISLTGNKILEKHHLERGLHQIPLHVQPGIYLVKAAAADEVHTQKVFIK